MMYSLKTESYFDSAHFLYGYEGKCSNIHGHRWRVVVQVEKYNLIENGCERGMVIDFSILKSDLRSQTEALDHALIVEKDSLKENTINALNEEGFKILMFDFRPTAENFAKYFWDRLKNKGYSLSFIEVYETPENCARYSGSN